MMGVLPYPPQTRKVLQRCFNTRTFQTPDISQSNVTHDFRILGNRPAADHAVKVERIVGLTSEKIDNWREVECDTDVCQFQAVEPPKTFGLRDTLVSRQWSQAGQC